MTERVREGVGPLYLFTCLILGGSAQGIWQNMVLQLLGVAIIAWAAWSGSPQPIARPARQLLILALLAIGLVALQTIPLPPSVWTHLGGRRVVGEGLRVLGLNGQWMPLSLTPFGSLDALFGLIPPLALFCAIVRLSAYRPSWLVGALLAGTVAGVMLGVLQVTAGGGGDYLTSHWYVYAQSSYGRATGFFANANHMADLLVCTLPFLAALLASARGADKQRNSAVLVLVAATGLLVLAGIALNHSLAVYLLTVPVLVLSALILLSQHSPWRRWSLLAATLLLVGGLAAVWTNAVHGGPLAGDTVIAVQSRQEMLATSASALRDFLPWGSGLGSFESVYHLYEDPTQITNTYVIHAHNDYVELALEMGVAGILLMLAFLLWWARSTWRAWRYPDGGPYARAASIGSAAILIHSLVDFPLRTAAMSAVMAMCLALLVERRWTAVRAKSDLRPTRHVVLR